MMEISVGALVLIISVVAFIFPAGIFVGRLSQRVDHISAVQRDFATEIKSEFRELRRLLLIGDGEHKEEDES